MNGKEIMTDIKYIKEAWVSIVGTQLCSLVNSFLTELFRQQCQSSDIQNGKQLSNKRTHDEIQL